MKLSIATCQFPVSGEIHTNLDFVLRLMSDAKARGTDVAHFPETCLSGYVGNDLDTNDLIDWRLLASSVCAVMATEFSCALTPPIRAR